tara:strand:- start:370 stop:477 length:108 start_codon:yes stop_codon:yes gene_type:complete
MGVSNMEPLVAIVVIGTLAVLGFGLLIALIMTLGE